MPRYYPMMMDIRGRMCVVVGGGEVAARKVETLVDCGANVAVVAPDISAGIAAMSTGGKVSLVRGEYHKNHLKGAALAIAATDHPAVNRAVFDDANAQGIPVNVVDVPELCTFIVPSVIERGDLIIAVSTSGKSPAMAKRIRKEMEKRFGAEYAEMIHLLGEIRPLLQERVPDIARRTELLTAIVNSNLLERLRAGERPKAEKVLEEALAG